MGAVNGWVGYRVRVILLLRFGFQGKRIVVDLCAPLQLLRIYYVGGKLLNGIKSIYINSIAFVRIKVNER